MTKEEVLKKFFYLSNRFTFTRMAERKYCKIGYTGIDALSGIERHTRLTDEHERLKIAINNLAKDKFILDILNSVDLKEESKNSDYKFSTEEQYKYSEKTFGIRICIDDLMEKL